MTLLIVRTLDNEKNLRNRTDDMFNCCAENKNLLGDIYGIEWDDMYDTEEFN